MELHISQEEPGHVMGKGAKIWKRNKYVIYLVTRP